MTWRLRSRRKLPASSRRSCARSTCWRGWAARSSSPCCPTVRPLRPRLSPSGSAGRFSPPAIPICPGPGQCGRRGARAPEDIEQLLKAATALYTAKGSGRNRTMMGMRPPARTRSPNAESAPAGTIASREWRLSLRARGPSAATTSKSRLMDRRARECQPYDRYRRWNHRCRAAPDLGARVGAVHPMPTIGKRWQSSRIFAIERLQVARVGGPGRWPPKTAAAGGFR